MSSNIRFFNFKSTNYFWWNVTNKNAWLCNYRCVVSAMYTNNVQATDWRQFAPKTFVKRVYILLLLLQKKGSNKFSTNVQTVVLKGRPLPQQLAVSSSASVSYLRPRQAEPSAYSLCVLLIGVQNQFKDEAPLGWSTNSTQISRSVFTSLSLRFKYLLLATTETEISKVPPLQ